MTEYFTDPAFLLPLLVLAVVIVVVYRQRARRRRFDDLIEQLDAFMDTANRAHFSDAPVDWAALRAAYLASPDYIGQSRFSDRESVSHKDEAMRTKLLLMRDYPLLDTLDEAAEYYNAHPEEGGEAAARRLQDRFRQLADYIAHNPVQTSEGPALKVLSMAEQYMMLIAMGREMQGQKLTVIDGEHYDLMETDKGPLLFDVSAYFERSTGLALQR